MTYAVIAVERAMKIQEVILRAMSGALTWLQAAELLGLDPRSSLSWRSGTIDLELSRPSARPRGGIEDTSSKGHLRPGPRDATTSSISLLHLHLGSWGALVSMTSKVPVRPLPVLRERNPGRGDRMQALPA